jgi:hypothetical protein
MIYCLGLHLQILDTSFSLKSAHTDVQDRVNPARPPCSYLGQGGMVEGHAALTDGDCDETLGRDMDIEGERERERERVSVCVYVCENVSPSPVHSSALGTGACDGRVMTGARDDGRA